MRKIKPKKLLFGALLLGLSGNMALAQNCESYLPEGLSYGRVNLSYTSAQTFTLVNALSYYEVSLELAKCPGSYVNAELNIVSVSNATGLPNLNDVLATAIVSDSEIHERTVCDINAPSTYGTTTFEFSSLNGNNTLLQSGVPYALVLNTTANSTGGILWRSSNPFQDGYNPYADGVFFEYNGGTPLEYEGIDLSFEVCGSTSFSCVTPVAKHTTDADEQLAVRNSTERIQVFTPVNSVSSTSEFKVSLEIAYCQGSTPTDARLDIVTVTNGIPDVNNVLGTDVVPYDEILIQNDCYNSNGIYKASEFSFSGISLLQGEKYAMVLKFNNSVSNSLTVLQWRASRLVSGEGFNSYHGGNAWEYRPFTQELTESIYQDFQFDICSNEDITCEAPMALYNPSSNRNFYIDNSRYSAQVFTAEFNSTLALELSCDLSQFSSDSNLIGAKFDVVTVINGVPQFNNAIGSGFINAAQIPVRESFFDNSFGNVSTTLNFSTPLIFGSQYALVLVPLSGNTSDYLFWRASSEIEDGTNPYSGGDIYTMYTSNGYVSHFANRDFDFSLCLDNNNLVNSRLSNTDGESINNNEKNIELNVFPNPTTGSFTVDLGGLTEEVTVKLLSITGKVLVNRVVNEESFLQLNIDQAPGIYLLMLEDSNGNRVTKKIIKQ